MSVRTILHCCVTVYDMEEAIGFFRDLLGFKVVSDGMFEPDELGPLLDMSEPDCRTVCVRCPDESEIELMEFRRPQGELRVARRFEDAGIAVLTLIVDDVEETVGTLADNGYPARSPVVRFEGPERDLWAFHCYGPSGLPLTIGEWRPHAEA